MAAATAAVAASVALCRDGLAAPARGWPFVSSISMLVLLEPVCSGSFGAGARFAPRLGTATACAMSASLPTGADVAGTAGATADCGAWETGGAAEASAVAKLGFVSMGGVGALCAGGVGFLTTGSIGSGALGCTPCGDCADGPAFGSMIPATSACPGVGA